MASEGPAYDLRDIPLISLKKIREVTEKFSVMQVEDFNPNGDKNGPEYSWNMISPAVLFRDNYTCRVCGNVKFERVRSEKEFNKIHFDLQVHHIIPRKEEGKSNFRNLITLCEECHHRTFSNGYSGVPIRGNASLYRFNEKIVASVPPDFLSQNDYVMRTVTMKEMARVYDDSTSQYRAYRTEESSMNFRFPVITRMEFQRVFRSLADNGIVTSYLTLAGISNRKEIPVRIFTDANGSMLIW